MRGPGAGGGGHPGGRAGHLRGDPGIGGLLFLGDVEKTARKAFRRLGMENTADRNGVLIFLVPSRKRFAILGDAGIHEKVGQAFWHEASACLSSHFRKEAFTEGLVEVIRLVGDRLATHFPSTGLADRNELPDEVDFQ